MSKTFIVFKKEYLTRVKKKSFIIMTLLVPILMLLLMTLPVLMTFFKTGTTHVAVLDESGEFSEVFDNSKSLQFHAVKGNLNELKARINEKNAEYQALLYIPKFDIQYPGGFILYSDKQIGMSVQKSIENKIQNRVETLRFINAGIDKDKVNELKVSIDLENIVLQETGEKKGNAIVSIALSQIMGFFQYFMIFFYGGLIMMAVTEEKKNRIVEIIVSSIPPFQLMLGKIYGIAAVAITQLIIWIVFISLITMFFSMFMMPFMMEQQQAMEAASSIDTQSIVDTISNIEAFNIPLMVFAFSFFFIFGYLFYSALFAGAGAVTDDSSQNQTITIPLSIPIILSLMIMVNVSEQPHSPLAIWSSIIPFCSPIIMIARLPFGVPAWQLILSMVLLVLGFMVNTWIAGKIYRIGILMYGKKINWNDIRKWLFVR
jgi:ABC-2 type transport system permease protein